MGVDTEFETLKDRFQVLVDRFSLRLEGASPFDALTLNDSARSASHGEQLAAQFLLRVWDPGTDWTCGRFDHTEAAKVWLDAYRQAYAQWMMNPFFP